RAEWYRLAHSRAALGGAVFLIAVSALRVYAARMADLAAYAAAVQRALSRGTAAPPAPATGNAWGPFADGWLTGLTVATLLLLILSARSLAGDREAGLLRVARTRSVSRLGLLAGRALLGVALVLAALVLTGGAAFAAAAWWFDYLPVQEGSYVLASTAELRLELLRAVLATLPPLLATWCFGLLVSSVARGGTGAVSGALALYLGFDLFKTVLGERQYLAFAAFNPSFVDHSCLKEFAGIARGFSDAGYSAALYSQNLWLPWPQAALLLVLAGWVVSRRAL
ncbi:MAG TPA: ABC transporter permease subunit, partial [Planctomycetota bacterium]|nr:ABC transporter permease subunit [Planctomycetota bacterium]